jgi:F-box/leucine-rich repeat protein 7
MLTVVKQSFCCALSDTATEVLSLGCPHLISLKLSFCGSAVSDSSLRSIGLHLLELKELSVRGCVRVTGVGVEAVVEGCTKLRVFDVSQCKNLSRWLDGGGEERSRRVYGRRQLRFETRKGSGRGVSLR